MTWIYTAVRGPAEFFPLPLPPLSTEDVLAPIILTPTISVSGDSSDIWVENDLLNFGGFVNLVQALWWECGLFLDPMRNPELAPPPPPPPPPPPAVQLLFPPQALTKLWLLPQEVLDAWEEENLPLVEVLP